ncbi:MAG: hypothetical protein WCV83_01165 [Candidatus Magasanikbacteria bacterium]|jgi:SNF family Na+-dependent transporter
MDNPFNKKVFLIGLVVFFIVAIITEIWQNSTGYIFDNAPWFQRFIVKPIGEAIGLCIIIWVWPKRKKEKKFETLNDNKK